MDGIKLILSLVRPRLQTKRLIKLNSLKKEGFTNSQKEPIKNVLERIRIFRDLHEQNESEGLSLYR